MKVRLYSLTGLRGNFVDLDYGGYNQSQINILIDKIGSFSIPPHVGLVVFSGNNFDGRNYKFSNPGHKWMKVTNYNNLFPYEINSVVMDCSCFRFKREDWIDKINVHVNDTVTRNGLNIGYNFFDPIIRNCNEVNIPYKAPIIMILDFGNTAEQYRCIQENFAAKGHKSLIVQQRGTEFSDPSDVMTFGELIEDIRYVAVKKRLIGKIPETGLINDPAPVVIGFGIGGALAQQWALTYRFEISRLVLVGTAPFANYYNFTNFNDATLNWINGGMSAQEYANIVANASFTGISRSCEIIKLKIDLVDSIINSNEDSLKRLIIQNQNIDNRINDMQFISRHTLIIAGNEDEWVSLNGSRELKKLLKHSVLRQLNNIGHYPQLTSPEDFYQMIFEFVKKDYVITNNNKDYENEDR